MTNTIHTLNQSNSVFNHYIAEIRDVQIQKDTMRFRRNLERIGEIMAYELSKMLNYQDVDVTTPLGTATERLVSDDIVLATVLRAGLPMHNGFLNIFDKAGNAFVSAFRKSHDGGDIEVEVEYKSSPSLDNKVLIIVDPMLATGKSLLLTYEALLTHGNPAQTHIAAAIGSTKGLSYLQEHLPANTHYWLGALDKELNTLSYIVPGLGDAGDLAYGGKE
jgi:uracil phosphoribosyltransferase